MQDTDTAQFDYPTMLTEWRDFLDGTPKGERLTSLIVAASRRHAELFRDALARLDLVWDDVAGGFANSRATAGFDRVLDYEDIDSLWRLTFEHAADELL